MRKLVCIIVLFIPSLLFGQITHQIDEFSDKYYGMVQVENNDEVFKKGWVAVYEKRTNKELIKVTSEELAFSLHEGKLKADILELPYGEQSLIIHDDFNFDKIKDFAIQDGQNSCYHGPSFKIYLAQNEGFVFDKDFTRLAQEYCGMFRVDVEEKKIYTMTKSGCCWHQFSEFIVENNKPKVIKIVEDDQHSFPYITLTVKERKGGKMTETIEKTINLEHEDIKHIISFKLADSGKKVVLFNINDSLLNYALITKDETVEFDFPIEAVYKNPDFIYIKDNSRIIVRFTNKNAQYEVYQFFEENKITKIGIQVKINGKMYDLKGEVSTIKGDLKNIETVKLDNVVFN